MRPTTDIDTREKAGRFRSAALVHDGRTEVLRAVADGPVGLRVLRDATAASRDAAALEAGIGEVVAPRLARVQGAHEIRPAGGDGAWHPAVAWDWVPGTRLDAYVARKGPTGLPPSDALAIAADVHGALAALHDAGFVHRRPTPEHVIVDDTGRATLIGLGRATRKRTAHPDGQPLDDPYVAPEVQRERSGRFHTWQADVFSFGLLLAYLATGERPTGNVTAPLTRDAFLRLHDQPEGVALLIGRCTQPLQKNRIGMRELGAFLSMETLPDRRTAGFGPLELIAAWGSRDPSDLRVGSLTPGPLVNRTGAAPGSMPAPAEPSGQPPADGVGGVSDSADDAALAPEPAAGDGRPSGTVVRVVVSVLVVVGAALLAWWRLR